MLRLQNQLHDGGVKDGKFEMFSSLSQREAWPGHDASGTCFLRYPQANDSWGSLQAGDLVKPDPAADALLSVQVFLLFSKKFTHSGNQINRNTNHRFRVVSKIGFVLGYSLRVSLALVMVKNLINSLFVPSGRK
jgi:hypothetical protein